MVGEVLTTFIVFAAIVFTVRAIIEGVIRFRALSSTSDASEVLNALKAHSTPFHLSALKWGLGLGCLGAGFLVIQALNLQPDQPGTWGVIALSIATGLLSFYGIARKQQL